MDFGNLGGLETKFNQSNNAATSIKPISKPISKPSEAKANLPLQSFSFEQPPIKITTNVKDNDNPFAEIESGFNNPILPIKTTLPK